MNIHNEPRLATLRTTRPVLNRARTAPGASPAGASSSTPTALTGDHVALSANTATAEPTMAEMQAALRLSPRTMQRITGNDNRRTGILVDNNSRANGHPDDLYTLNGLLQSEAQIDKVPLYEIKQSNVNLFTQSQLAAHAANASAAPSHLNDAMAQAATAARAHRKRDVSSAITDAPPSYASTETANRSNSAPR